MSEPQATTTLCRFWVKPDRESEFVALMEQHWPTFQKLGLVVEDPPHLVFRGTDPERGLFYVEVFPWKDRAAADRAHSLPEVASIWEPMGECCTSMEFPFVERLDV